MCSLVKQTGQPTLVALIPNTMEVKMSTKFSVTTLRLSMKIHHVLPWCDMFVRASWAEDWFRLHIRVAAWQRHQTSRSAHQRCRHGCIHHGTPYRDLSATRRTWMCLGQCKSLLRRCAKQHKKIHGIMRLSKNKSAIYECSHGVNHNQLFNNEHLSNI